MSRPILSRPRTRVYGCNYDKGESYYKPMVDHLDRKYSARPLFPEARGSLADEIAARRSDIGSRDLSGPRTSARDLDLEFETPPRSRTHAPHSLIGLGEDADEDMVYDIRGQRTNRRNLADDFASEVAATTRRFKAQAAAISYDSEHYDDLRRSVQQQRRQNIDEKFSETAKSVLEDADAAFKRRTKLITDTEGERSAAMTRWSKLPDLESDLTTPSAASRARQSKARLDDLETEMEEMAERQAKRERRAAALRAFVNDNATEDHVLMEQRSRHLAGTKGDTEDDLDFLYEGFGRPIPEDEIAEDYVAVQRRFKQRAAEAFEEDLAALRRKRRDLQDRLFDMVDVGAEIERAKTTLESATLAFQKHATKFDNKDAPEEEPKTLVARLEKTRKIKDFQAKQAEQQAQEGDNVAKKVPLFKWSKFAELENEMPKLIGDMTKARIREEVPVVIPGTQTPIVDGEVKVKSSEKRRSKKRSVVKRKKSVAF